MTGIESLRDYCGGAGGAEQTKVKEKKEKKDHGAWERRDCKAAVRHSAEIGEIQFTSSLLYLVVSYTIPALR